MDKDLFTILKNEQVFGTTKSEIIKKTQGKSVITDLAIASGGYASAYYASDDKTLRGRLSASWSLSSEDGYHNISVIDVYGNNSWILAGCCRGNMIRPAFYPSNFQEITTSKIKNAQDVMEIEYGEYPQYIAENTAVLERKYQEKKLEKTGKVYSLFFTQEEGNPKKETEEFEYKGKKYIRFLYDSRYHYLLSNEKEYARGDVLWLEVSPIKWLIDEKNQFLLSKNTLISGIRFCDNNQYDGIFENTELYSFLNKNFAKDIIPSRMTIQKELENISDLSLKSKRMNAFDFKLEPVTEEDIIKGAIASDIPLFLHGASSEGKTSRVKQIDPNCVEIHMENATLESFVGKSVYNQDTGEMKDIPPTWYRKITKLCEEEPDKIHILFFEEFTNATPSVQGKVNNVVLDRILDGKWPLPKNVRIVAAGNEVSDSLAANPLTETVFNRFAHVYIKTTTKSWLKWANENHIHPAIYSYIAYRNGETLRSPYDGIHPNADPRKWEMASKMLYETGNPEMLRSLVGESITRDFIAFCNKKVITIEDVITGNYTLEEIEDLNIGERYATILYLSQVTEEYVEVVRDFAQELGKEYQVLFDVLWTENREDRLLLLAELRMQKEISTSKVYTYKKD